MERALLRNVDLETFFLLSTIGFAAWIFFGSLAFPESTQLYPFFTSLGVIILGGVLLLQKHPPSVIRRRLTNNDDEEPSFFSAESGDEFEEDINERSVGIIILIYAGYIIVINILGFLVSSMALMYVVQRYYDYGSRLSRLLSVGLVAVFVYAGYIILDIDLDQGMIWNSFL